MPSSAYKKARKKLREKAKKFIPNLKIESFATSVGTKTVRRVVYNIEKNAFDKRRYNTAVDKGIRPGVTILVGKKKAIVKTLMPNGFIRADGIGSIIGPSQCEVLKQ